MYNRILRHQASGPEVMLRVVGRQSRYPVTAPTLGGLVLHDPRSSRARTANPRRILLTLASVTVWLVFDPMTEFRATTVPSPWSGASHDHG